MVERMPSFADLPVGDILMPEDRLRPLSEAKVAALTRVIEEGVFLGAITVRRNGKINTLIDGAHRLEAMRRLGRETIRVDVLTCSASEARQLEITGNITAGMTPIQDAIFLGVYQAEYERMHPDTKRGVAGGRARHGQQPANLHFAELVAESRQISAGQVRRIIAAGRALTRDERNALQSVSHRIPIADIEKIGKLGNDPLRSVAVEALLKGKKVTSALRAAKGDTAKPNDPKTDAFKTLVEAWKRAPQVIRRRFVAANMGDLQDLLDQLGEEGVE